MGKPSTKDIWMIDDTLCDLLVHDTQADRAPVEIQAEQRPGRTQLICSIDPYTRLIATCSLSYEEKMSEH